ncbi:hypothetical protein N9F33_03610, partial [Pseudomonadales bacterium]|nr:hypothetical protein [Pseudomonadales bacterium]
CARLKIKALLLLPCLRLNGAFLKQLLTSSCDGHRSAASTYKAEYKLVLNTKAKNRAGHAEPSYR